MTPPDDAVVVIRGGLHSLDAEKVIQVCEDSFVDFGFYGLSVFAAFDGDAEALCLRLDRLRSPGTIWVANCGRLRAAGFELAATDAAPHFDVVLPSLDRGIVDAVAGLLRGPRQPGQASVRRSTMVRQLTVDFNRVVDGALIRANARRAVPGTVLEVGSVVVVGDDD